MQGAHQGCRSLQPCCPRGTAAARSRRYCRHCHCCHSCYAAQAIACHAPPALGPSPSTQLRRDHDTATATRGAAAAVAAAAAATASSVAQQRLGRLLGAAGRVRCGWEAAAGHMGRRALGAGRRCCSAAARGGGRGVQSVETSRRIGIARGTQRGVAAKAWHGPQGHGTRPCAWGPHLVGGASPAKGLNSFGGSGPAAWGRCCFADGALPWAAGWRAGAAFATVFCKGSSASLPDSPPLLYAPSRSIRCARRPCRAAVYARAARCAGSSNPYAAGTERHLAQLSFGAGRRRWFRIGVRVQRGDPPLIEGSTYLGDRTKPTSQFLTG
jgi:hypothetical protein